MVRTAMFRADADIQGSFVTDTQPESPTSGARVGTVRTVVNHTVFPTEDIEEVRSLYFEPDSVGGSESLVAVLGRRAMRLSRGARVSFATYFNAFPAGYWHRWSMAETVRLSVHVRGSATLSIFRSDGSGNVHCMDRREVLDSIADIDVPLDIFADGGFCWFDLAAGDAPVELAAAQWSVIAPQARPIGRTSVGMTTFNRPASCLAQLAALAASPELEGVIDRIVVVDQGDALVENLPGFAAVAEQLGERLDVFRQANLGGSGGFSRAMIETIDRPTSEYVILLDDDAITEPEAILRAVRFADFAANPVLVGGAMLNLAHRSVLYVQGETWMDRRSWMRASSPVGYDHDFATRSLRATPGLHRTVNADFNGWWFCLVPTSVLREIGLAMPLFLKFDDAEYALRARAAGYPLVSLPGVGVWHEDWTGKDPTRTWEGYFILRNQIITGLLHSRSGFGGILPIRMLLGDAKLLLMQQYGAVRLRHEAVRDALSGPDDLPAKLAGTQRLVRALRDRYPDAQAADWDAGAWPPSTVIAARATAPLSGMAAAALAVREGIRHVFVRPRAASRDAPDAYIEANEVVWWRFAGLDSALVGQPLGGGASWSRRNGRLTRRMLGRSILLSVILALRWPSSARRYRAGARQIASAATWAEIFRQEARSPH